jgi:hypothetical protein
LWKAYEAGKYNTSGTWVPYVPTANAPAPKIMNLVNPSIELDMHRLQVNQGFKLEELADWITTLPAGDDNVPTYLKKVDGAYVPTKYASGEYIFFRPVFLSELKVGIVYDTNGHGIYADTGEGDDSGLVYENALVPVKTATEFNDKFGANIVPDYSVTPAKTTKQIIGWDILKPDGTVFSSAGADGGAVTSARLAAGDTVEKYTAYKWTDTQTNDEYKPADGKPADKTFKNLTAGVPRGNYLVLRAVW